MVINPTWLAVAAAVSLAACGSDESSADRIRGELRTLTARLAAGDADAVCRAIVEQDARARDACVDELGLMWAVLTPAQRAAISAIEYGDVDIRGDRAVIRADQIRIPPELASVWEPDSVHARRINGEWRIATVAS